MHHGLRSLAKVVLSHRPRLAVHSKVLNEVVDTTDSNAITRRVGITKHGTQRQTKSDASTKTCSLADSSERPRRSKAVDIAMPVNLPSRPDTTPTTDPFARFDTLHAHSNCTMSQLLASIPHSDASPPAKWTTDRLLAILSRESDPKSLRLLVQPVWRALSPMNIDQTGRVVGQILSEMGRWSMVRDMKTLLLGFRAQIKKRHERMEVDLSVEELQMAYWRVFTGLKSFAKKPMQSSQSGHLAKMLSDDTEIVVTTHDRDVDAEVFKTVEHMLKRLEGLEGDKRLRMYILDRLFNPRFLTPKLRRLLLSFDPDDSGPANWEAMEERHWHWCWVTAVLGGESHAGFYMTRKNRARARRLEEGEAESGTRLSGGSVEMDRDMDMSERSGSFHILDASVTDGLIRSAYGLPIKTRALSLAIHALDPMGEPRRERFEDDVYTADEEDNYAATDTLTPFMWSTVFTRLDQDSTVTAEDIIRLMRGIPHHNIQAIVIMPAMQALLRRGQPSVVWDIWLDLLQLESKLPPQQRGLYVDVYVLGMATQACGALRGVEAAVRLVDGFAQRPARTTSHDMLETIQINEVIVNQLFFLCREDNSPSIAFRMWAAAQSRWGVRPDHISLAMMQDIARRNEITSSQPINPFPTSSTVEDSPTFFRERWQNLMEEIWGRRRNPDEEATDERYTAYNADGFSKGGSDVLLDPPDYSWFAENGTIRPWQRARSLFRELEGGSALFPLAQLFTQKGIMVPSDQSPSSTPSPDPEARWCNVIPDSAAFMAHIKLLGYFQQVSEIPLVFAQMGYLNVRPSYVCMLQGLMYIAEVEGPPRRVLNGVHEGGQGEILRDEDIMRKWLTRWLGNGREVVSMGKRYTPEGLLVWKEGVKVQNGKVDDELMLDERMEKTVRRSIVPTKDDVWQYRKRLAHGGKKLMYDG